MAKKKIDFSKVLPWRLSYLESAMPYARRRIDRFTTGGNRDGNATISGPRQVMGGKFAAGELQLLTPTARQELNGLEKDYINSDWGIFISGSGAQIVENVIYNHYSMDDYITIVHSEAINRKVISTTTIPKMLKHHARYGLDMIIPDDVKERLTPGGVFKAQERVCHTRATMKDGNLGNGRLCNSVFVCSFSTNEDTCAILDTTLEKFAFTTTEEFSIAVDNEHVPIKCHGTDEFPRAIPAVGDIIDDGIIMAIRRRRPGYALAHKHNKASRRVRRPGDIPYYCKRGGEVISVEVIKTNLSKPMTQYLPEDVVMHLDQESARYRDRYRSILSLDYKWLREYRKDYVRDPSWNIEVTNSIKHFYGPSLTAMYPAGRCAEKEVAGTIDDNIITGYLIRIKVRAVIIPHLGYKLNEPTGAKYTISEIRTADRMFTDDWGRVSEIITAGDANINRAIWGRLHSHYRGDALFHLLRNTREMNDSRGFDAAKDYYIEGIKLISDNSGWMLDNMPRDGVDAHIRWVIDHAEFLQVKDEIGDESMTITGLSKVENSKYAPPQCNLKFTDYRGRRRTMVSPMRIGCSYVSLNENAGSDYSACNIPLLQHSGMTRKLNSLDRKTSQISGQSNRVMSEACFRMLHDSQPKEDVKIILRAGTCFSVLTDVVNSVLDGNMVPDLDISSYDSRGLEIHKVEVLCEGVQLTNLPRHKLWKKRKMKK